MAAVIERPVFEEGQVLSAEDLRILLDYSRNHDARHVRTAHLWGIAEGLEGKVADGTLKIQPGMAYTSSGATVVLTETTTLIAKDFTDDLMKGENAGFFPLYLLADTKPTPRNGVGGRCGGGTSRRIRETGSFRFDRLASLQGWRTASPAPIGKPLEDDQSGRRVLLGFVAWNGEAFTGFQREHVEPGIIYRPQFVGVRGEVLESATGRVQLRVRSGETKDIARIDVDLSRPAEMFALGIEDARGNLNTLFSVDKEGNVKAKGVIAGSVPLSVGMMAVQSGQATDGVLLTLPEGFTLDKVEEGSLALHILVSPRFDLSPKPTDPPQGEYLPVVQECMVDRKTLQVRCTVRWYDTDRWVTRKLLPGVCDYQLIVAVKKRAGEP